MDQLKTPKDNILASIKEYLQECLIYESLPQNSQIIVVDKSFSCLNTFHIFVKNDCVDCVTWNTNIAFFERILTYTDVCEIIVKVFFNNLCKISNREYFDDEYDEIKMEEEKYEMEKFFSNQVTDIIGKTLKLNKSKAQQIGHNDTTPPSDEMQYIREFLKTFKFNNEIKTQLLKDLKVLTLNAWFHRSDQELNKQSEVISIDLEKRLSDACEKMKVENLHRIIILDREKQLVVGTLTHRDILLFIIRNFKGKNVEYFKTPLHKLGIIGSIDKPILIRKTETLLMTFYFMLKKKLSAIPIIDEKDQYFGLINKSDMFFIIKDNLYEMLIGTTEDFLNFLNREKNKYKATKLECSQFYTPNESILDIIEKLLFSNGNRLFYLNETTKQIVGLITLTDLFKFYLELK